MGAWLGSHVARTQDGDHIHDQQLVVHRHQLEVGHLAGESIGRRSEQLSTDKEARTGAQVARHSKLLAAAHCAQPASCPSFSVRLSGPRAT